MLSLYVCKTNHIEIHSEKSADEKWYDVWDLVQNNTREGSGDKIPPTWVVNCWN